MKALITGAYGFIGRNLFQRLMYDDCFSEIILLSRRLRTKIHSTPNKTIKQYAIRTIINVGFGPFFSASMPNNTVEGIATRFAIKNKAALIVAGSLST